MKKKVLSLLLVAAMGISMLVGCGGGNTNTGADGTENANAGADTQQDQPALDYTGVEIKVWVADNVVDFTNQQVEAWKTANPDMAGITVTVEPVGEGDAAGNMITDVQGGADIFGFAQDQIARLVAAEALMPIGGDYATAIATNNDAGAAGAAKVGDITYAFPMTSDNGYFMYYDKSVVTDVTNLDAILAACEAAGKGFYFDNTSAWYNAAFFFATGCVAEYTTDNEGNFVSANITYASPEGVEAVKGMINLHKSSAFVNGASVGSAANAAVVVTGTWDAQAAKDLFGDNYACAKLPTFTTANGQVQLSGFGGFKLLGIKPQTDAAKQAACLSLANWLSAEEAQLARFEAVGWGPSNLNAQASEAVKADAALSALAEQLAFTIPQGQYPQAFWDDITAFGNSINSGEFDNLSDEELLVKLQELQTKLEAAATPAE